jgi:hypothetical protein
MGNARKTYKFISASKREESLRDANGNLEVECISEKWGVRSGPY